MEQELERTFHLISSACGRIVTMIVRRKYNGPMRDVVVSKLKSAIQTLESMP